MSADTTTFSFPLRSLGATGQTAPASSHSPFLLGRFHGDDQNKLVRRWCDARFMTDHGSPWPLVLYGPAGTGKSALAETLACRLKLKCCRLTSDDFRRQFLAAVATRSTTVFRQRLQNSEMLVLDDLALPDDEPALIREFVQIIDFYRENSRPLIVTTRQVPWMMEAAFNQLRSRLSEGLSIEIKRPGLAARREIASGILEHLNMKIVDEDLDWLAGSLPGTAPLIKSYLSRVALESTDSLLTRDALKSQSEKTAAIDPDAVRQLIKLVARQLGQRVSEISGKTRRKEVVRARSVAMYLARNLLNATFREVGDWVGGRDPSTARHACARIHDGMATDPNLAEAVNQVSTRFNSYLNSHASHLRNNQPNSGDNLSIR